MERNAPWNRDELILALALFFQQIRADPGKWRNANGVYMKLCNFLPRDPGYKGKRLRGGNRLEQEVWDDFASDKKRLAEAAAAIKARLTAPGPVEKIDEIVDD